MTYEIITPHANAKDITGHVFGRLTAIAPVERTKESKIKWLCVCDCGTEHVAAVKMLSKGVTRSCGCRGNGRHGMSYSPEYQAYSDMKKRVLNKSHKNYKDYGGRGIKINYKSFEEFYADVGKRLSPKHTIDRINNNGHYERGNCRWATWKEQHRNKRSNVMITFNGKTQCLQSWAEDIGINPVTLANRLRNWTLEDAITTHVTKR